MGRFTSSPIRRARPDEAVSLSDLAWRSKAAWGYDAAFMASCRETLTLSPADVQAHPTYLFEVERRIQGFYALAPLPNGGLDLTFLFVEPAALRGGVGRALWDHALETARDLGHAALTIESDPHAEGFYLAMGAVRDGDAGSPVGPSRRLPRLVMKLAPSHRCDGMV